MRNEMFIVGALSLAVAVVAAGCGSSSGDQHGSTSAGAAGAAASSAGAGGGAAGGPTNRYVIQLRTNAPDACMPRELPFGATGSPNEGRVSCTIGELHFDACDCEQPGRTALSGELLTAFEKNAEQSVACGGASGIDCAAACGCELVQLPGSAVDTSSELYACQNDVTPPADLAGFCVIDQEHRDAAGPAPIGNPEIVADCPASTHRRIRFIGDGQPSPDAAVFITCTAQPL